MPELAHRDHDAGEQAVAVGLEAEVRELEQRDRVVALLRLLDDDEGEEHERPRSAKKIGMTEIGARRRPHDVAGDREVLDRRDPAVDAALAQREHEREHADRDEDRAGYVDLDAARRRVRPVA